CSGKTSFFELPSLFFGRLSLSLSLSLVLSLSLSLSRAPSFSLLAIIFLYYSHLLLDYAGAAETEFVLHLVKEKKVILSSSWLSFDPLPPPRVLYFPSLPTCLSFLAL